MIQPKILGYQPLEKKPLCSINRLKYTLQTLPSPLPQWRGSWRVEKCLPAPKRPFKSDCKVQLITRLSAQLFLTIQLTFVLFWATRNHTTLTWVSDIGLAGPCVNLQQPPNYQLSHHHNSVIHHLTTTTTTLSWLYNYSHQVQPSKALQNKTLRP